MIEMPEQFVDFLKNYNKLDISLICYSTMLIQEDDMEIYLINYLDSRQNRHYLAVQWVNRSDGQYIGYSVCNAGSLALRIKDEDLQKIGIYDPKHNKNFNFEDNIRLRA